VFDFVFLAVDAPCTGGTDGCYIGNGDTLSPLDWRLSSRPWLIHHLAAASDASVSDPYLDQRTENYVLTFVQTIYDGAAVLGYVGIDIELSTIPIILAKYEHDQSNLDAAVVIVGSYAEESRILFHSEAASQGAVMAELSELEAMDLASGFTTSGYAGLLNQPATNGDVVQKTMFGANVHYFQKGIDGTNWDIIVLTKVSGGLGLEGTFIALLASTVVILVLIALFLSKRINRTLAPIGDILSSIDEIKKGNFETRVRVKDNNELKTVADAINMMSQEIGDQIDLVYRTYLYDAITGLRMRRASHDQIEEEYLSGNEKTAVLLIDVDNLKNINVTKGQSVGDEILKAFAERLQKTVRYPNSVYFNGSNEFLFFMPKIKSLDIVESEILKVFDRFREPISVKNLKIEVRSHIGVAVYPTDGKTMEDLVKRCDTALFKAKEKGRGSYVFYNDTITREVTYKAQVNEQLADALERGQLYLKYQPLIDNRNEIYGFEALVRWNSPTLGEISPQVFVANAEESQMIIPIGNWILKEACKTQVLLRERFQKPFVMSVNVSPVQILQKDFIDVLKNVIRETDIDPKHLVLEITENVVMESSYLLEKTIDTIHQLGAKIALDDFGTGYASLTYLRQLPFDNLKIDKSFVDGIFASKKEHSIIGTIVELVHNLNMKVVAEGVETRKQYEFLKQIATDVFQGFLFSKPLPYLEAVEYIDQFYKVARQKRIDVFANKDYGDQR
jgi:diguanylate cyclase (GGDEF)-like protein